MPRFPKGLAFLSVPPPPQEHRPLRNGHVGLAKISNFPGFISGRKALPKGFYEGLEGGPVGMLSSYDAARIKDQTILVPFGKGTPSLVCNRLWQIGH